jgi:hypothetical protein
MTGPDDCTIHCGHSAVQRRCVSELKTRKNLKPACISDRRHRTLLLMSVTVFAYHDSDNSSSRDLFHRTSLQSHRLYQFFSFIKLRRLVASPCTDQYSTPPPRPVGQWGNKPQYSESSRGFLPVQLCEFHLLNTAPNL